MFEKFKIFSISFPYRFAFGLTTAFPTPRSIEIFHKNLKEPKALLYIYSRNF